MPDESPEVIEQRMQETRDSLTQKVSALESQVVDTLQSATATVSGMVDQVKTAVPETLAGMKDTIGEVRESVAKSVRETLDVSHHTRQKPWAMVGGAAAVGFIAGMVLFRRTYTAPAAVGAAYSPPVSSTHTASAPVRSPVKLPRWLDQIVDKLGDKVTEEVRKLGELAVASASASLQQTVEKVVPQFLGNHLQGSDAGDRMEAEGTRNGYHATASSRI
jgi:ElaB/YqjD/DUF883 family membrane-anchored ribosome-binding protein